MSDLEKVKVESEVYRLEEKGETVATAKSQFAEEKDIEYSNVKGKVLFHLGTGWANYPKYVAVIEVPV